jgi:hypothetical protein
LGLKLYAGLNAMFKIYLEPVDTKIERWFRRLVFLKELENTNPNRLL